MNEASIKLRVRKNSYQQRNQEYHEQIHERIRGRRNVITCGMSTILSDFPLGIIYGRGIFVVLYNTPYNSVIREALP